MCLVCVERIRKIFNSDKISRDVLTNRDLMLWIGGLLLVELVFLIGYSGAELQYADLQPGTYHTSLVAACQKQYPSPPHTLLMFWLV